jgi:uncharacterized protein YbjT (DUF2867 family)
MRIAVIGGTGTVGHHTVEALARGGHDPLVLSRSRGVDVTTGQGLDEALAGVDTVIDVSTVQVMDADATPRLFATGTRNILAAEQRAGVRHHVLLSIVGIDRVKGNPHLAGKRAQEEIVTRSPIPFTIQRATQFFEFTGDVIEWMRQGDTVTLPPLLLQPVAAADVGAVLAGVATGAPLGRTTDVAGPDPEDFVDMARRTLEARGEHLKLVPSWRTGIFGVDMAGEALLPGPDARLLTTTFDAWLESEARVHA